MKIIQTISLLIIMTMISITSCNQIKDEKRVLMQGEGDSLLILKIPDAACDKCQKIIEGGLLDEQGIKQSILNLKTREVSVVYDPQVTSPEIITATITKLRPNMPCYSGKELVR
ncbi:MAG: heavy-metal-associated domain-containing protein [Chitinophagales bacterium]|nr:heavy-metal-associated domain-containing protein [Chitinophagales bacterium]